MTQTSEVHGMIAFSMAQAVIERRADRVSWNTIDGPIDETGVVKFTDVTWAATEPSYLFSRELWERHQAAPIASPSP